jgi:uncharacterized membrane protein YraQ (UPF0718 family)
MNLTPAMPSPALAAVLRSTRSHRAFIGRESPMLAWMPAQTFASWLSGQSLWAVPTAALIGVPAYLNGTAAVPLAGALMKQGLDPAVVMTFLVAGGITSVPAAHAVRALVRPEVFALHLTLALAGSIAAGWLLATSGWLG